MGIKGVKGYMKSRKGDFLETINICDEIKKWMIKHEFDEPIILIDLRGWRCNFFKGDIGVLLGGRFDYYNTKLRQFIEKLQMCGAKLIFFDLGRKDISKSINTEELQTNVEKTKSHQRYVGYINLMDAIEKEADVMHFMNKMSIQELLRPMDPNTARICSEICELHVTDSHNLEIAEYLTENDGKVMAIITDDSDFLAVHDQSEYWNLSELNPMTMKAHSVQILTGGILTPQDLRKEFQKKFTEFSEWYNWKNERSPEGNNAFVEYCKVNKSFMYIMLTHEVLKIREITTVDYRKFEEKNYADLVMPLALRICGVLFKDDPSPPQTRTFLMKYTHEDPIIVKDEEIIYPTMELPSVTDLIVNHKDETFNENRWSLLAWILEFDQYFITKLRDLEQPNNIKVAIITLQYLLEQEEILLHEAQAVLLTEYRKTVSRKTNFVVYPEIPNIKFIRVAHLYPKLYIWMNHCLETCGLSSVTDLLRFNAPAFYNIMEELEKATESEKQDIQSEINSIWTFE